MAPEQKQSWWIVGCFIAAVAASVVLTAVAGIRIAPAGFGVLGLGGLAPLIFPEKRVSGRVARDERDKAIAEKATLGGGWSSYLAFLLACMIPWFIYRFSGRKVISIHVLPVIVMCGMLVFMLVRSVAILVLYGREEHHAES